MNKKKVKLRLRKPFAIILPVLFVVLLLSIVVLVNNKSAEINNLELTSYNVESDYSLSDSEYLVAFNKMIENRKKDNTIISYAEKYNLDIEKTLAVAHVLTNNYEDENFLETNIILPAKYRDKVDGFKSFEAGAIYFVKDLYTFPSRYGFEPSQIRTSDKIDISRDRRDGTLYMSNGLTFEQYLGKICDLFDVDKEFALAVVYHESGRTTSGLFNYNNNIGGQRGSNGWMKFTSLEAGTIYFVLNIKAIINRAGGDTNTYAGISRISGIYVRGNIEKPSENWINKVMLFKNKISEKDLFTISK